MNIDPKAEKYFEYSTYNYVMNNPMYFVDPNGEDVYLFYYLRNNHYGGEKDKAADKMFWSAAMTRANDFLNSEGGENDVMVMKGIDSMSDLEGAVEGDVAKYSEKYGKTAEFGLWSHSGLDGPFRENSNGSYDQLSPKDWSKIDFNWSGDAKANFYGCRSGKDPDSNEGRSNDGKAENSFVQNVSSLANFRNVDVSGQTERSWPSSYTNVRSQEGTGKTYMVGSKKAGSGIQNFISAFNNVILGQPTYAYPMSTYRNGKFTGYHHQPGAVKK